jgi:hypothetical protein
MHGLWERVRFPSFNQRVGFAVGGWPLDPFACAGLPSMNRLHPLLPETRSLNFSNFSSMHSPIVELLTGALGSICHHLQSLQGPHEVLIDSGLLRKRASLQRQIDARRLALILDPFGVQLRPDNDHPPRIDLLAAQIRTHRVRARIREILQILIGHRSVGED